MAYTPTLPPAIISTANSTASVLGAGAVFTGTSEDVTNYAVIQINVIASHVSATDGLAVQFSSDGTNWDHTDTYSIPSATGKSYSFQPVARYFRITYTNGATLQTSFRLQVIFHAAAMKPSSQRSQDGYSNETDLEQVWAFNSVWNGATWDRLAGSTVAGARTTPAAASAAALTQPTSSATTTTVLAANTARRGVMIHNDSTAVLYLAYAATASLTAYSVKIPADAFWEMPAPHYLGLLSGIWSAANGAARVTELT